MSHERPLETRVQRLEVQNRVLMGLAIVLSVTFLLGYTTRQAADVVQAHRIQIVDDSGRVRMDLRHDSTETGLFILDGTGTTRVGAAQFAHGGGGFALHGPEAKGAAVLYLRGRGSLTFYDERGEVVGRVPDLP